MPDETTAFDGPGFVSREDTRQMLAAQYDQQSRRFERLLSSISDFTYTFDLDGRFTFVNKPLLDLWGLTLEQAVGKNFFDLKYPHELATTLQRQIQDVIENRQRVTGETPYTSPTGAGGYYQYIFSPVMGADGSVEAVAGTTRDITDRKQLEVERDRLLGALRNEQSRLAAIIERAPAFICILRGPEHIFELANEHYYELIGKRDIIGKPILQAIPEVQGQGYIELLNQVYRTGEPYIGSEMPVLLQPGAEDSLDRRFVNFVYQALREADGSISSIFVHGVDVTDMVRSRQALRQSEERLRALMKATSDASYHMSPDWGEMRELHGSGFIADTTQPDRAWIQRYIHPQDQANITAAIQQAVRDRGIFELEHRVRRLDGGWGWTLSRAVPLLDVDGSIVEWFGASSDMTERKRAEEERERLLESEQIARAEAEAANRAKDKFLAVLSHELRTPLSPVVMTIPAIEIDPDLPLKFRDDLAMVRRNIDLEVKLIDDLLDLSRVSSGKLRLQIQPVGVHELLRHVLYSSVSDISGKRLHLQARLDATNDTISGDPARLQQVFWNLLRNAAKFTPENGDITVRTWNGQRNGHLFVAVQDSGVGIAPEVLPRIFDAFEQGDMRTTRQFGGLGLGLAIAKAVIDMHGGAIHAHSAGQGQGAIFTVRLNTVAPSQGAPSDQRPSVPARAPGTRLRILLVEDHPDTARILAQLLMRTGYDVRTAGSVSAALQLAADEPFDVVVSDIGLPDATGYDLMEKIRERHGIKGIALSGYGMEEDMRRGREAGFVDYVVKPINVAQLDAIIRRVTSGDS